VTDQHHRHLSLRAVARHAVPNVVLSTVVPTSLFYVGWYTQGRSMAFVLALSGALTVVAWRAVRRQRVPAMLILTTMLLVARTVVGLMTGSTKVYFVQPIITTVIVGTLFLVSVAAGQPLIKRLAGDFLPLPKEIEERDEVRTHFRRLSLLWAGIYFINATVTLLLLMNLPVTTFVATKTVVCLAITWCGIFLTFSSSRRVLRAVGMIGHQPATPVAVAAAEQPAAAVTAQPAVAPVAA
jgi:intracellular septation protein A